MPHFIYGQIESLIIDLPQIKHGPSNEVYSRHALGPYWKPRKRHVSCSECYHMSYSHCWNVSCWYFRLPLKRARVIILSPSSKSLGLKSELCVTQLKNLFSTFLWAAVQRKKGYALMIVFSLPCWSEPQWADTALFGSHPWVKCLSSFKLKGHSICKARKSNYMAHVLT